MKLGRVINKPLQWWMNKSLTEVNIMGITSEEISQLESAKTEAEWNNICDQIQAKRNGKYPNDWYEKVILANLNSKIDKSIYIETR